MKKRLFRTVVACFLAGVALTWVGCSDYDDDINKLNNRIDELTTGKLASIESQQASLQSALDNLRGADTALGQRIDDLKSQIGQSGSDVTAADLKKLEDAQASLKSTIEGIEDQLDGLKNAATQDWVMATLKAYATTQEVGKITATIEALGKFTSEKAIQDAIDAAKNAAVEAAGEAFKTSFQSSFDAAFAKASADYVKNTELQGKIDAALEEYDQEVAKAIKAAVANDGVINEKIATDLAAATKEIKKFISARVTSVQLIPELYEDGIEAIELKSLAYNKWTINENTEKATKGTQTFTTSQAATTVRYHVSPSAVQTADIEKPSFVFEKAETRAAVADELVMVDSYKIAGGILTVDVKKNAKSKLDVAAPFIYTAALKVPIAKAHLAEDEGEAAVYSDYVKLTETVVVPSIAALTDKNPAANKPKENKFECTAANHYHFSADYDEAQAAQPSIAAAYNGKIDLTAMVTGCYEDANGDIKELTKAALKNAGLEFRFAVPKKPYEIGVNNADQQKFITVGEENGTWYATSKLPDGTTNNQAAIDKTPIVRVELVDTQNGNAIADVRYFKVVWNRTLLEAVDLGTIKTFEHKLNCNDFIGEFFWDEMVEKILSKLNNEKGMSYDEFKVTYQGSEAKITTTDKHALGTIESAVDEAPKTVVENNAGVEVAHNFDADKESTTALAWKLTAEQIGTVIEDLQNGKKVTKNITVTIPAKNQYNGSLTFKFEVNITLPTLPAINGYDATFWQVNYSVANIYPVQYNTPTAQATCEYNYELDRLFADSKIVKNMLPCGKWDLQFAEEKQPNGYKVPFTSGEPAKDGDTRGYYLEKGTETAVSLNFNGMGDNWYGPATQNAGAVNTAAAANITVKVECNDAGKGILGQNATMKVWAALNDYNRFALTTFNVHFVEPLKINTHLTNAYFVDQIISGSEIDCSKAFSMTDFKDYIVAKVTTGTTEKEKYAAELYYYYAIVDPVWNLAEAKTNLKKDSDGNYVVDETITATGAKIKAEDRFGVDCITLSADGTKLIFKNINGVKVEKQVKLFIPVTVEHKWGTLTENVVVDLYPEEPSK